MQLGCDLTTRERRYLVNGHTTSVSQWLQISLLKISPATAIVIPDVPHIHLHPNVWVIARETERLPPLQNYFLL